MNLDNAVLAAFANSRTDPSKSLWARWTMTADRSLDLQLIVDPFPGMYYFEVAVSESSEAVTSLYVEIP